MDQVNSNQIQDLQNKEFLGSAGSVALKSEQLIPRLSLILKTLHSRGESSLPASVFHSNFLIPAAA